MQGSVYEIQTSTHWNLMGCNMTAWPPVFFRHVHLIAHFKKIVFF